MRVLNGSFILDERYLELCVENDGNQMSICVENDGKQMSICVENDERKWVYVWKMRTCCPNSFTQISFCWLLGFFAPSLQSQLSWMSDAVLLCNLSEQVRLGKKNSLLVGLNYFERIFMQWTFFPSFYNTRYLGMASIKNPSSFYY